MPHVEISHFPAELDEPARRRLEQDLVAAVTRAFEVREGAVSIGLAPVGPDDWQRKQIIARHQPSHLLLIGLRRSRHNLRVHNLVEAPIGRSGDHHA